MIPCTIKRETRVNLHRLRLGYRCVTEIRAHNNKNCKHCKETTTEPLLHYLLECPVTAELRNVTNLMDIHPYQEEAKAAATGLIWETCEDHIENLIKIIEDHPPPR
ncbi:hypothetical protein Pcinc_002641 [Petrolisthes cinctipes]|uniref:Uncharacterized protein n=1 Tax=Petrolisthes cinctipes TaxID=88211 RepID=A0AAE1G8G2_PETCI|nr:hypothetical protein Pcinc_008879 [Petrolisthes cinctipes]KAK3893576.1 hypothetical protein Pcinc_002641 [Petrolisthes cinctipes]